MNNPMTARTILTTLLLSFIAMLCSLPLSAAEPGLAADAAPKGPHGGRLLSEGDFSVELAIFEAGVPPEYHAWAYRKGQPLGLQDWQLTVSLSRLGGRIDNFAFVPATDFLLGQGVVEEPHSFDVRVAAQYQGRTYMWDYPSYEGRVQLAEALASELQVETSKAGPGTLHRSLLLFGHITPDPQGISHITARYPGLIRLITAELGQRVKAGDALAVIEANSSLQSYTISAPIDGLVIQRYANPGEFAGEQPLLTIADYRRVWTDLDVFPGDARTIQPGQTVTIRMGELSVQSRILYLNPGAGTSPNVVARVPLDNPLGQWTPGLLVEGDVQVAETAVALMIDNRALQRFRDWQVVFIKVGSNYEIRPLTLGRSDGRFTEVLEGLNVGDEYVVANSYLLKADLEKSGASHDH
ncbi:MAG: efflux RND transporter periplasmic adaptor subunit [Pseudomonadales bacterium]|nr:efflux RND transporter periplasmic adaptor subunit [Pseudomonadales bacterium]